MMTKDEWLQQRYDNYQAMWERHHQEEMEAQQRHEETLRRVREMIDRAEGYDKARLMEIYNDIKNHQPLSWMDRNYLEYGHDYGPLNK